VNNSVNSQARKILTEARHRASIRFRLKLFSALWLACLIVGTIIVYHVSDVAAPYWTMLGILGFPVAFPLFYVADKYLGQTEFAERHSTTYTTLM
jgi:hypothetical protein